MPNNKPVVGKPGSRLIRAAGAVAWRPGPDGEPEVLLVHRKKYDDWSLPKGKTEPGEPLPVTAVREVLEEGGARLALGRRLISVRYKVGGRPKRVHYWAARVESVDERAVPNAEVDEVAWVPAVSAVEKVSYVHDHGVLADFAARPAGTVPLILLRHAKAAAKGSWKRSDVSRPLDDVGRSDAKALVELLAGFASRPRLISSPAVRCMDTLRPLAQFSGAKVREEKVLYMHNQPADDTTAAALAAIVEGAIASGEPTVICAHRENLPVLQEAALAALAGHPATTGLVGGAATEIPVEWDDDLPTGGFWVLNVAPLRTAPEPVMAALAEPAPGVSAAARHWWQLRRTQPTAPAPETAGAKTSEIAAPPDDEAPDTPPRATLEDGTSSLAGILVSADRYDLSEP